MKTFAELSLLPEIQKSLTLLGFTTPTEIQAKIIPLLLEDVSQDVHAQAQTGTGKTLAFGIPLLQAINPKLKEVQGLIVAPTRELVLQIYESLKEVSRNTNIAIEPIYGGMPIQRQIMSIRQGAQIIVGTPGRLNDHLRRKTLSLKALKILVLDEADIMLEMGFKEEVDSILSFASKNIAIWLFSATVLPGIKQLIASHMENVLTVKAAAKTVVSSQVKQYYCVAPLRNRVEAMARIIEATPDFYGIIFCQTKVLTTEVMEQLASKGFKVNCLHGDMKQALRNRVIKGFKNKDFNILVATDVAARGIDVSDLTHVINFSIPREFESYVHRIGRTGRAGKEGVAIVFVAPSEVHRIKRLEKTAKVVLHEIPVPPITTIINAKMGAVSDFIEQAKQSDDTSPVYSALKEIVHSFTPEEIQNSLIKALEDKFFKDIVQKKDLGPIDSEGATPQEICMELGNNAGFTQDMIRNYLYSTCKLLPQEVSKVRVLPHKTFISIPENRLEECITSIKATPLVDKPHKVYLVKNIRNGQRHQQTGRYKERDKRRGRSGVSGTYKKRKRY